MGLGMGAGPVLASVVIEILRGAVTAFVLTWLSPGQQGVTLGELRSELHTGRCPQPAEVSISVISLLYAFVLVGAGLFFCGLVIGVVLAAPLAAAFTRRRSAPQAIPAPDTIALRLTGGGRGVAA